MIFFFDFQWHNLGFLGFFSMILARNPRNTKFWQEIEGCPRISKTLARNEKNPRSWQEIQDCRRTPKTLTRKPRHQALGIDCILGD